MRTNTRPVAVRTHEGARAKRINPEFQLRRAVMACFLWEKQFYESGQDIGDRIEELVKQNDPQIVASMATEARDVHNLRHVPLLLAVALADHPLVRHGGCGSMLADTIRHIIQRPDEAGELLALYWRNGKRPIAAQIKKGLASAMTKFDRYQLTKWQGKRNAISLADVLKLVRPKPVNAEQSDTFQAIVEGNAEPPGTWENRLSAGEDKGRVFTELLEEGKLGYMALLRNLRNMDHAGVDANLVRQAIRARRGAHRVLPFRFVAAARACPRYVRTLDDALCAQIEAMPKLPGETIVLVDVSASMSAHLSARSDLSRMDAAATLASVIHAEDLRVFSFSTSTVEVPPHRGMAGVEAIDRSQWHGATNLGAAVRHVNRYNPHRLIVISDEQSQDRVPDPTAEHAYMINVASYKNGVGYGRWTHIDGFSESVLKWIYEFENMGG
jgi:hypothetical protein